jgi:2-amino-4-hydroxy-6-hydroxymethyldihydropteridine diphosphokinase
LFNEELHDTGHISIPHPELANRRFALIPLADIAASYVHPVLQKTIAALLLECRDTLNVKKISE